MTDTKADAATPWLTPDDGPVIKGEVSNLVVCTGCGAPIPVGAKHCEKCGRFAPGVGRLRRKKGDVEQLLKDISMDYGEPTTTIQRGNYHDLALTLAELKVVRIGSPEWQRLIQGKQTLITLLEDARASATQTPGINLDALSDDEFFERLTKTRDELNTMIDERAASDDIAHMDTDPAARQRVRERYYPDSAHPPADLVGNPTQDVSHSNTDSPVPTEECWKSNTRSCLPGPAPHRPVSAPTTSGSNFSMQMTRPNSPVAAKSNTTRCSNP